jgi:preprotein translocase subunit SecD
LTISLGCQQSNDAVTVQVFVAEEQPGEGLSEMRLSGWGQQETFYLHGEVLLDNSDIDSASVVPWRGYPAVEIMLSEEGRERFTRITSENIGNRLGFLVNGQLVCAPVVRDTIVKGKALINGEFSEEEALRIAKGLNRQ